MNIEDKALSRRRFLTAAAVGGLLSGTIARAADEKKPDEKKPAEKKDDPQRLMGDNHTCRGLNTCKGKGKGGDNACAGQGKCAIAKAHSCHAKNDCKGQGGCGTNPGQNSCKGTGACAVPLKEGSWKKARKSFEEVMKKAGKTVGPAPKA